MVPYRYGYVGREHQTQSDVKLPFFETRIKTSIYERVPALQPGLCYFVFSGMLPRGRGGVLRRVGLQPGCRGRRILAVRSCRVAPAELPPLSCSCRVAPAERSCRRPGPELFRRTAVSERSLNYSAVLYGRLPPRDCSARFAASAI